MSKKTLKAAHRLLALCFGLLTLVLTPMTGWAQEPKDVTINYVEAVRLTEAGVP